MELDSKASGLEYCQEESPKTQFLRNKLNPGPDRALSEDGATPWPNSDLHKDVSVKNWTEKLMRAKRSAMNS